MLLMIGLGLIVSMAGFQSQSSLPEDYPVNQLLEVLGAPPSPHKPNMSMPGVSVARGRDLVEKGLSKEGGIKSRRQSKYFDCLACHNKEREDPILTDPDPEARLNYVQAKGLPLLQGSSFFGIVNRDSFYNGDYDKKYGDLVKPTRDNIREAMQLCAVECSQGRALEEFELESILAYLWTLELKLSDLDLTKSEFEQVAAAFSSGQNKESARELLQSKYLQQSPATFLDPPKDRRTGDGLRGDPKNGKLIYELSCQYCHFDHDYSFLILDDLELTFKHLANKAGTYGPHSLYQVVRYGTYPKRGKRAYMPQYTKEKLSDQQMADLRAYIDLRAKGDNL